MRSLNHFRARWSADRSMPTARRDLLSPLLRTVVKSWRDDVFAESAAAAFWQTLSLPPLLLGLLGSLGFLGYWFGADVVTATHTKIIALSHSVFSANVVDQIIGPTVADILTKGRSAIVSAGFVLSLWAGSSALASLVDSITLAHGQEMVRNAVWQRLFALLLYLVSLVLTVVGLPVLALGPQLLPQLFPASLQSDVSWLIHLFYYPITGLILVVALTTLYKVALPRKFPWHRGLPGALLAVIVFLCASSVLRAYITWITSTGYTYGALATPIAFLLFAFFLAFAVILGAQFNNALQETWPARMTRQERRRWHRLEKKRTAQRERTEEGHRAWATSTCADPDRQIAPDDTGAPAPAQHNSDEPKQGDQHG